MATNKSTVNRGDVRKPVDQEPDVAVHVDLDVPDRVSAERDREPLFKLNGVIYTMPRKVPLGVSLEYLRLASTVGEQIAVLYALQRLIDQNGYAALVADDALSTTELSKIIAVVTDKVADGFRLPKA